VQPARQPCAVPRGYVVAGSRIDDHIADQGLTAEVLAPEPMRPLPPIEPMRALDTRRDGIGAVVWATGYRRRYPWLQVPVLDGTLPEYASQVPTAPAKD